MSATSVDPGEYFDTYNRKVPSIPSLLVAAMEPVTARHFPNITSKVQGQPERCLDIKLTSYRDTDFKPTTIQATMRHLHQELSKMKSTSGNNAGRVAATTPVTASSSNLTSVATLTAARAATTRAVASCLARCTKKAISLVLDEKSKKKAVEGVEQKQFSLHKTTTDTARNSTRKGLRAQRR